MKLSLLPIYILVFFFSYMLVYLVRMVSIKRGWYAYPRGDRWSSKIVAMYGGVGFVPVIIIGIICVYTNYYYDCYQGLELENCTKEQEIIFGLVLGTILMFFIGLADDIKSLTPGFKFFGEVIAASLVVFAGGYFQLTNIVFIDAVITYFWIVGITNAINMLDNMDGLSAGIVIIGTLVAVSFSILNDQIYKEGAFVAIGLVFLCALLGFWMQNRQPAKIFMGDSGSLAIGFILAVILIPNHLNVFFGIQNNNHVIEELFPLIIPVTVMIVPIFDTTLVTITRKWRSQKVSVGGLDHSSHRLVAMGFSENSAVRILFFMAIAGGFIAHNLIHNPYKWFPVWLFFTLLVTILGVYLGHVKVKTTVNNLNVGKIKNIISLLVYKVRLFEMILDLYLVAICYYTAHLYLYDLDLINKNNKLFITTIPYVIIAYFISFYSLGNYRISWRPISFNILIAHLKALISGTVISFVSIIIISDYGLERFISYFLTFSLLFATLAILVRTSFGCLDQINASLNK